MVKVVSIASPYCGLHKIAATPLYWCYVINVCVVIRKSAIQSSLIIAREHVILSTKQSSISVQVMLVYGRLCDDEASPLRWRHNERDSAIASQITSPTIVYSAVYSDADQRKHQSSASLAFVWGIHRDRWIPRTKGQLRGKCFHLMTSSCYGSPTVVCVIVLICSVHVLWYLVQCKTQTAPLLRTLANRSSPVGKAWCGPFHVEDSR